MIAPGLSSSSTTKTACIFFSKPILQLKRKQSMHPCKTYLFYVVPHGSLAGISRSFPAQNHICAISFWCIDSCRSSWGLSFSFTKTHTLLGVHKLSTPECAHFQEKKKKATHLPNHHQRTQLLISLPVFWLQKEKGATTQKRVTNT